MIDKNHKLMQSIFAIFKMTKDKEDFIENLGLIYDFAYFGI